MLSLPRVAVGTVQPDTDIQPILWAMMEALRQQGIQVQSFLSRACFARYLGEATATGLNPRHLDSWLMSAGLCREIFVRGAACCDLAIVEGEFSPDADGETPAGGRLETLCEWLDLPRIAVLDVSLLADRQLPDRPEQVDGLLLDRVGNGHDLAWWTTNLETLWGVPVLGALETLPRLRAAVEAVPAGDRPSRDVCRRLGGRFLRHSDPQRIVELAFRRDFPWAADGCPYKAPLQSCSVVAIAYDEALNCYFPDTLDGFEVHGATVVDFSPLRDERLPEGTDIVYLGCGHPERYAVELSQNHCIKLALRNHLREGGRIYAEGGGLAYLCQQVETPDGRLQRMTGIFPAVARLSKTRQSLVPVEVTLARPTWLGQPGDRIRGYLNPNWILQPAGSLAGCVAEQQHRYDLVRSCRAIGSRLHLDFAAQAHLLPHFFQAHLPQDDAADPWATVPKTSSGNASKRRML